MKFGFILPNFGDRIRPRELVEISKACEEEGFDSVWATDHVIMPTELREPYGQLLEPLVTLSFISASTEKLKVGTSILVLPQRNPIVVAKQAAALDAFSNGRLIMGFGAGWAEKEFGFLGADFRRRGSVMDESIELIRKLWTDKRVDFGGRFYKVQDAVFLPKPVQEKIPIWIAGNSRRAVRRAIRLGDGWHPTGIDLAGFKAGAEMIKDSGKKLTLSVRMGTDVRKKRPDAMAPSGERRTYFSGGPTEIRKSVDGYASMGLEYCCVSILHPSAREIMEDIRKFSDEVLRSYA